MNHPMTQTLLRELDLADGSHWEIVAGDAEAASIVSQLGAAMRLGIPRGTDGTSARGNLRRLLVQVDARTSVADCYVPLASGDRSVTCVLSPNHHWGGPFVNLVRLSLVIARGTQSRGGVLLHGALAARDGMGVILAAPGGTGKTTASNRLPAPWHSLCDDTTLVACDPQGRYWAHPWPTWSRFMAGGEGGAWNVQGAVPLAGIFMLARATEDRTNRVGPGEAAGLFLECARQASMFMPLGLFREEVRALHLERFANLSEMARVTPTHMLHITLTGTFWQEIDKALNDDRRDATTEPIGGTEPEPQSRNAG